MTPGWLLYLSDKEASLAEKETTNQCLTKKKISKSTKLKQVIS